MQSSLHECIPSTSGKVPQESFNWDVFAEKVASKVMEKIHPQEKQHEMAKEASTNLVKASNLLEYLQNVPEIEILGEENCRVLKCSICSKFLSSPASFSSGFRRPSGKATGSLSTGITLSENVYDELIAGKCYTWYHQKERLIKHVSSNTHVKAVQYMKDVIQISQRKTVIVKNELRTALGIVKSKAATLQYEARIAELQAAGADVGDFGHSRKLFPAMLSVVCAHIDKRTAAYLSTCFQSTGMPPHFYVTADKSQITG